MTTSLFPCGLLAVSWDASISLSLGNVFCLSAQLPNSRGHALDMLPPLLDVFTDRLSLDSLLHSEGLFFLLT